MPNGFAIIALDNDEGLSRLIRDVSREYQKIDAAALRSESVISADALPGEFMMNALRLVEGVEPSLFVVRTGCGIDAIATKWKRQQSRGLMRSDRIAATPLGLQHLDTLVSEFL